MHSVHSVHSVHPPCPGRLSELSAWGSVLSALSALSALENLSYIVSELGVGLHWERRVSYIIRDKKQGGEFGSDYTGYYCRETLLQLIQNQEEFL